LSACGGKNEVMPITGGYPVRHRGLMVVLGEDEEGKKGKEGKEMIGRRVRRESRDRREGRGGRGGRQGLGIWDRRGIDTTQ